MRSVDSVFIGIAEFASMLGVSRAKFFRMKAAGELPEALELFNGCRWKRDTVAKWIASLGERPVN